jgi:hypothetical protein
MFYNQQESMKNNENPFERVFENNKLEYNTEDSKEIKEKLNVAESESIYDVSVDEQINKLQSLDIGTKVQHKKFGVGEIVWFDKKRTHIKVIFGGKNEKMFLFPDSIMQKHLQVL